tara:strand:- start:136 stop:501 length:366 start_codon:yes stop_codon:yes gene_type:complete
MNTYPFYKAATTTTEGFLLLKLNGSGELTPTTADTDVPAGVSENTLLEGQVVNLIQSGSGLKFRAEGAIAIGAKLAPSAATAGYVKTAASGDRVIGYASQAAADGDLFSGELIQNRETVIA